MGSLLFIVYRFSQLNDFISRSLITTHTQFNKRFNVWSDDGNLFVNDKIVTSDVGVVYKYF